MSRNNVAFVTALAATALSAVLASSCASAPSNETANADALKNEAADATPAPEDSEASHPLAPEQVATDTATSFNPEQPNPWQPSPTDRQQTSPGGESPARNPQRIWIVDSPAHAETIHHEAEGYWEPGRYYTKCTACGADITGQVDAHLAHYHPTGGMSWTDSVLPSTWHETTPAWDETVNVPEQGHWEWQ